MVREVRNSRLGGFKSPYYIMKQHKLEDRLFAMKPIREGEIGRYIPFCDYDRHRGIIIHNKHRRCEKRECNHYHKLWLTYNLDRKV